MGQSIFLFINKSSNDGYKLLKHGKSVYIFVYTYEALLKRYESNIFLLYGWQILRGQTNITNFGFFFFKLVYT